MGRRKGSRNLTAEERLAKQQERDSQPKRSRGRPKGSLGKPKVVKEETFTASEETAIAPVRKRGRPKGTCNRGYTVSEKVIARQKAVTPFAPSKTNPRTPEDMEFNTRLISHIMQVHEIAANADKNDLLSLKSCFIAYLKLCQTNGFSVTNLAAYASMGFDNAGFNNWLRTDNPDRKAFGAFVRETCAMFRESMVNNNKLNPVIGIFWQRNFDGLRNDTEQVQSALEQQEDYDSGSKSYKEKYRNLIGE